MPDPILFDLHAGIITLTINRPEVRNALNWEAMHALAAAVERTASTPDVRAVILCGAGGRAFISGGDIRDLHNDANEDAGLRQHDLMAAALDALAGLAVPVIAALEGATRGGGMEVALACDLRIAAADATLGFAQVLMGVTPGWGGAGGLMALVGYSRALEMLTSGRVLSAEEALTLGLINRISRPGGALDAARAIALEIAAAPPLAVQGCKAVLRGWQKLPAAEAAALERNTFGRLWTSSDHREASSAFVEKRSPRFSGK